MSEATTTEFTRARYYRLAADPTLPFVWWGLLPLLLFVAAVLFGLTHFGTSIEGTIERDTKMALQSQGFSDVRVQVDGQNVHLTGLQEKELDRATKIAEGVEGNTVFGLLTSSLRVTAEAEAFRPKPLPTMDVLPTTAPVLPWADMVARLENGELLLTGDVETTEVKLEIGEQAMTLLQPPRFASVHNELRVTAKQVREGSSYLAKRAVASVAGCDRGEASVRSGVFTMTCAASAAAETDVRSTAESSLDHGEAGAIEILLSDANTESSTRKRESSTRKRESSTRKRETTE